MKKTEREKERERKIEKDLMIDARVLMFTYVIIYMSHIAVGGTVPRAMRKYVV